MKNPVSLLLMTAVLLSGLSVATVDTAEARKANSKGETTKAFFVKRKKGKKIAKRKHRKKINRVSRSKQLKAATNTPPPSGPTNLAAEQRVLEDIYCGPGHVPCDDIFTSYCALIGGTMSKTQLWGGKTCFHRTEW